MSDTTDSSPPFVLDPAADAEARALIARLDSLTSRETVWVDGCAVALRSIGEGPPLVLLHGGHGSWLHWVRNLETLSASHTLWVVDMPGYGDSGLPDGEQSLDLLVRTLCKALDQVLGEGEPYDLAGFSFGALCAATLAAGQSAVRRVALLGPAGHGQPGRDRLPMLDWQALPPGPERDARLHHNLAALMLHDPAHIDALALALHRESCANTRFRSKALSRRPLLLPALDRLAERGVPVLIAFGEHDVTAMPTTVGPALLAGVATRQTVVVPNAGHWIQYEAADTTDKLLLDWFAA